MDTAPIDVTTVARHSAVLAHDLFSPAKVDAASAYGVTVDFVETCLTPRAIRIAELLAAHPDAAAAAAHGDNSGRRAGGALAAVLTDPERFRGQRVCCVVTRSNADLAIYTGC